MTFCCQAQLPDCTLGLGSSKTENIITIFQLNAAQIAVLEELQGKAEVSNKILEEETKKLFAPEGFFSFPGAGPGRPSAGSFVRSCAACRQPAVLLMNYMRPI